MEDIAKGSQATVTSNIKGRKYNFTLLVALIMLISSIFSSVPLGEVSEARGLNPVPISPPPPQKLISPTKPKKYNEGKYEILEFGNSRICRAAKPMRTMSRTLQTVNSRLNVYGRCVSFIESSGGTARIDEQFRTGSSYTNQTQTYSLLMFPQIRDLIPPFATINSVILVTDFTDPNAPPSITVQAHEITSTWDPRTVTGATLPSISGMLAASGDWNLTERVLTTRSLDVTAIAMTWFNATSSQWGFKVSTPIQQDVETLLVIPNCLRLYVDYEMPEDSYLGDYWGGSWYEDTICPGQWIPMRATYFNKTGILGDSVKTRVFVNSSTLKPPFGFDNQVFRYRLGGVKIDANDQNEMKVLPRSWSLESFNTIPSPPGKLPPPISPGPIYDLDSSAGNMLSDPKCEDYVDDDGEHYSYTNQNPGILTYGMTDDPSEDATPIDPDHPDWYQDWKKKRKIMRIGPHGNNKATIWRTQDDPPEGYAWNYETNMEFQPQEDMPQHGVMDKSLPQVEYVQAKDIGITGANEDKFEKYFADSQSNEFFQDYAVNPLNAGFELDSNDFSIPVHGDLNMTFGRTFSSASLNSNGVLGPGWATNIEQMVNYMPDGYLNYVSASGEVYTFSPIKDSNGNIIEYVGPPQLNWKVNVIEEGQNGVDSHVEITDLTGDKIIKFTKDGLINEIRTSSGGKLIFNRDVNGKVTSIVDDYSDRQLTFTYDAYNRLTSVDSPCERNWTFAYNANGDMVTATDPENHQWQYEYNDKHNVTKVINPRNNFYSITYENVQPTGYKLAQVTTSIQSSGSAVAEAVSYSSQDKQCIISKPTGEQATVVYNELGIKEKVVDSNEGETEFKYDLDHQTDIKRLFNQLGQLVSGVKYNDDRQVIDSYNALENHASITYNTFKKIETYTDKENHTTHYYWLADGSLPLRIVDALNREILYTYDQNKNLVAIAAPYKVNDPAITAFEYDSNGYVNKITNSLGKYVRFEYNNCGELTKTIDALGNETRYTRNKMGKVTKVTGPAPTNYETLIEYDACMNPTKFTNPRGYYTQYEYNEENKTKKVIDALNHVREYFYDDSGKPTKIKDDLGRESQLEYDPCGRLLKAIDQAGKISEVVYDLAGRITKFKGPSQDEVAITYDILGRVVSAKSKENSERKWEFDKESNVIKTTDPENNDTTFEYDACYRVTKVTDALSNYSTVEYWPSGNVKKVIDPKNHKVEMDYDKIGQTVWVKDDSNNQTSFEYDDNGNPTKTTNALGKYTRFEYDQHNLIKKAINELGKEVTFQYDACLNKTRQTSPLGKITQWEYDACDRAKKVISPLGKEVEYTYDNVGNLVSVADPLDHLNQYTYTNTYKLEKQIDALNNQTQFEYNDSGDTTKVTSPRGTYTQFTYDLDHMLTGITDPMGNTTNYVYNKNKALTERKNPKYGGGQTSFTYTYDLLGRRTGFTDEVGETTTTTYDSVGLTTGITHPNGKTITPTYDNLNRMTGVTFGDNTTFSFAYDAISRNTSWTDEHGTQSFTYDDASRLTATEDPFGEDISYAYDDDNRMTSYTNQLGTTSTTYDDDSRPTSFTLPGSATFSNTFDDANRLTRCRFPILVETNNSYDNANRVSSISYDTYQPFAAQTPLCHVEKTPEFNFNSDKPSLFLTLGRIAMDVAIQIKTQNLLNIQYTIAKSKNLPPPLAPRRPYTTLFSFSYTYDANYNITGRTYPDGSHSFTYDNYDRLTQAVAPEGTYDYTYDVRSNIRTERFRNPGVTVDYTTTYSYTDDDRLSSYTVVNNLNQQTIRTASFTYDDAGNLTQKQIVENGNTYTTTYTYFDDNRIKTVTLPDTTVISFTYHADGSRATKTTEDEWITFHYNGGSLWKEVHHDAANHATILFTLYYQPHRLIYDPGSQGGGDQVIYYVGVDAQGTCLKLMDDQGSVVASYTYSPFGQRLTNSAPGIYNPLGFGGLYLDYETGLLFASSRYYDPSTLRFTTKDGYRGELESPISQNRYVYCNNNPVSLVDPSGFAPEESTTATSTTQKTKSTTQSSSKVLAGPPIQTNTPNLEGETNPVGPNSKKRALPEGEGGGGGGGTGGGAGDNPEFGGDSKDVSGDHKAGDFNTKPGDQYVGAVEEGGQVYGVFKTESGQIVLREESGVSHPNSYYSKINGFNRATSKASVNAEVAKNPIGAVKSALNFVSKNYSKDMDFSNFFAKTGYLDPIDFFMENAVTGFAIASINLANGDIPDDLEMALYFWNNGTGILCLDSIPGTGEDFTPFEFTMMAGFWVSAANNINGWGLNLYMRGTSNTTCLSLCSLTKAITHQWLCESRSLWGFMLPGTKRCSENPLEGPGDPTWSNNSMGVQIQNIDTINKAFGLGFQTSRVMTLFGGIGVGMMYMSMCLNSVTYLWKKDHAFTLDDLAAAFNIYNPHPDYASERMVAAFGSDIWEDIISGKNRKRAVFYDGRYVDVSHISLGGLPAKYGSKPSNKLKTLTKRKP